MSESTKAIASLKKAGNYMKLAMRKNGPRSFKRGQGALIKVIYKAGKGTLSKDDAKKVLGWRGRDVRFVAKKAADNGYLTIDKPKNGFQMTLTDLGREVIKKRLEAESKAADEILAGLSDEEKAQLTSLCEKICQTAEGMGVDYSTIQKKRGKKLCKRHHGKGQGRGHHHGHGCHHGSPQYVFVFEGNGGCNHMHDHKCHDHKHRGHKHQHGHCHQSK